MELMLSNPVLRVNSDVCVELTRSRMISTEGAQGTNSMPFMATPFKVADEWETCATRGSDLSR